MELVCAERGRVSFPRLPSNKSCRRSSVENCNLKLSCGGKERVISSNKIISPSNSENLAPKPKHVKVVTRSRSTKTK